VNQATAAQQLMNDAVAVWNAGSPSAVDSSRQLLVKCAEALQAIQEQAIANPATAHHAWNNVIQIKTLVQTMERRVSLAGIFLGARIATFAPAPLYATDGSMVVETTDSHSSTRNKLEIEA
jgi:hypothetical protein